MRADVVGLMTSVLAERKIFWGKNGRANGGTSGK